MRSHRTIREKIFLAMKLTAILLTVAFIHVHAHSVAQTVTLSGKELSLQQVFAAIEKQTGYVVFAKQEHIAGHYARFRGREEYAAHRTVGRSVERTIHRIHHQG